MSIFVEFIMFIICAFEFTSHTLPSSNMSTPPKVKPSVLHALIAVSISALLGVQGVIVPPFVTFERKSFLFSRLAAHMYSPPIISILLSVPLLSLMNFCKIKGLSLMWEYISFSLLHKNTCAPKEPKDSLKTSGKPSISIAFLQIRSYPI